MKRIYLDYAASSPLDPKVLKEMMPYLKKEYGNPSSLHSFGQKSRAALEFAREKAAKFLNCRPLEIVFTSGATEANNLAIRGILQIANYKLQITKPHIITSQIEHESVLSVCQELEMQGLAEVTYVPVTSEGIVMIDEIQKAIKENTALVSIMYANSEIGVIQPIVEIGLLLKQINSGRKEKIRFHADAVQAAHFLDCNGEKLGVDMLTLSSHKIYGPKGAGILYVKEGINLEPLLIGGGQEQGMRSGTENVAAIVGMSRALEEIMRPQTHLTNIKIRQLRDTLIKILLKKIPGSVLTGSRALRLSNNIHMRFEGIEGRDLVMALDEKGFAVSTGSACSEKTQEPSHVLLALGLKPEEAMSSLRVTLGKYTTREEIGKFIKVVIVLVEKLREGS